MKKFIIIVIFLLVIIFIIAGGYYFLDKEIKSPYKLEAKDKIFEIREGEGIKDIAINLKEEGLIKNDLYFVFYVWKDKREHNLKPGKYCLSSSISIPEIFQNLTEGPGESIKLTFPEGWSISKIEERLKSNGLIPSKEISRLKIKDFQENFTFLEDAPDEDSLEGYLFPDTYLFYCRDPDIKCKEGEVDVTKCQGGSTEEILEKFLTNFNEKLTSDFKEEIEKQQKTIFEIITMASLLEKEVNTKEDREIVSGIFWKRLREGRPLQSCATIAYVLEIDKWRYSFEDTRIESLYNTYIHKGLPIGPISNPGIESIKAAIFPKKTNYNYFLTDPATGNTIFAETIEEHNQNKIKYFK